MYRRTLWIGLPLLAALAAISAILYLRQERSFRGAVIDPPAPAAEINLTDHTGQPFLLSSLRGQIVVLFFGYTNCPDECPLTMAHLKQAYDILGERAEEVRVAMISTDPQRDTPQALEEFVGKFDPTFLGLTGTTEELARAWSDYGVLVDGGGEIHSTIIYVIDRRGNLRLTFVPDSPPGDVASDLKILLDE